MPPFEIKYSHETLLKEKSINEADLPQSIQEAIESFNAVKETLSKKSNELRSALTKELKLQSNEISDTITEWQKDLSLSPPLAAPEPASSEPEPVPAPPPPTAAASDSSPSPSMEPGGLTPPTPATSDPIPAPIPPVPEPKKKSGSLVKTLLLAGFGMLAITVGPEMFKSTIEWFRRKK